VVLTGDGPAALAVLGQRHVDMALLDIQMPGMDGWALARAIRALPQGAALPIAFLSAHVDAQDQIEAATLGARACLAKPFEPAALHDLLRQVACELSAARRPFQAPQPTQPAPLPRSTEVPARQPKPALLRLFAQQWPGLAQAIRTTMQACEALSQPGAKPVHIEVAMQDLRQALHALRGSLAVLAQPGLLQRTRAMEEGVLGGQLPDATELTALLHDLDALARLPG
jgi:CheY-like chemotaxis protein